MILLFIYTVYRLEIRHVESVVYLRLEPALRGSGPQSEDPGSVKNHVENAQLMVLTPHL